MSGGYMSPAVTVQGVTVQGVSVPGVSVQGVSDRGVCVLGVSVRGVHVRGVLSCHHNGSIVRNSPDKGIRIRIWGHGLCIVIM